MANTVTIDGVIGGPISVKGTVNPVSGLSNGSTSISVADFATARVFFIRGGFQLPGIDPGNGSDYYTKVINDDFLTLNSPLVNGETIYIKTIRQ